VLSLSPCAVASLQSRGFEQGCCIADRRRTQKLAEKAAALKHEAVATSTSKHAHVALAALKKGEANVGAKLAAQQHMSAKFNRVHSKQAAKERLGQKAQTYASEEVKSAADATSWMPFVLPPLGLMLLGGITFGVVTIRKWQKIPSMPTQGRMDIKDVQASAKQMGHKSESREMGRSWENL